MPSLQSVRRKIDSVKKTQKITKAMKMVAAAKLKRTQDRILAARPYALKMRDTIRALSRRQRDQPFSIDLAGVVDSVAYEPGESSTLLFGGNSNWRGPVCFTVNHLIIESMRTYGGFFGDCFTV